MDMVPSQMASPTSPHGVEEAGVLRGTGLVGEPGSFRFSLIGYSMVMVLWILFLVWVDWLAWGLSKFRFFMVVHLRTVLCVSILAVWGIGPVPDWDHRLLDPSGCSWGLSPFYVHILICMLGTDRVLHSKHL